MCDRDSLFFRALSDKTRRNILKLLKNKGELSVKEIVEYFSMTQPTISHHLNVLKEAGLVRFDRKGKEICYCCDCMTVRECCKEFFEKLISYPDESEL
ncbi:MAG: winged helix-turn-helix transcriptional regulator [Actinobacteria bacterium]|nr:winged helix-turn-helix transcriptional regulator [Actinomycetota bacterium]